MATDSEFLKQLEDEVNIQTSSDTNINMSSNEEFLNTLENETNEPIDKMAKFTRGVGTGLAIAGSLIPVIGDTIISPAIMGATETGSSLLEGKSVVDSLKRGGTAAATDAIIGVLTPAAVGITKKLGAGKVLKSLVKSPAGKIAKDLINEGSGVIFNRKMDEFVDLFKLRSGFNENVFNKSVREKVEKDLKDAIKTIKVEKKSLLKAKNNLSKIEKYIVNEVIDETGGTTGNMFKSINEDLASGKISQEQAESFKQVSMDYLNDKIVKEKNNLLKQVNKTDVTNLEKGLSYIDKIVKDSSKDLKKIGEMKKIDPIKATPGSYINRLLFATVSPANLAVDLVGTAIVQNDDIQKAVISGLVDLAESKSGKVVGKSLLKTPRKALSLTSAELADKISVLDEEEINNSIIQTMENFLESNNKSSLINRKEN